MVGGPGSHADRHGQTELPAAAREGLACQLQEESHQGRRVGHVPSHVLGALPGGGRRRPAAGGSGGGGGGAAGLRERGRRWKRVGVERPAQPCHRFHA